MRPTGATRGRINCGSTILITINKSTNKTNRGRGRQRISSDIGCRGRGRQRISSDIGRRGRGRQRISSDIGCRGRGLSGS